MTPPISPDLMRVPPIDLDANPQARSVREAIATGKYPERLSPEMIPPPFEADTYRQNPQAYLDVVEPGRIHQPASPGPGVPALRRIGGTEGTDGTGDGKIALGGSVDLAFAAPPGAPVSLYAADLGTFANGLTATTVQAGADGIAHARWHASGGVVGTSRIIAASPYAHGQVHIVLTVASLAGSDQPPGVAGP